MTTWLDTLIEQAPLLIAAVTVILLSAVLLGRVGSQPVEQQRWSEWAVLACLLCVPVLLTPMPRFLTIAAPPQAIVVAPPAVVDATPTVIASQPHTDSVATRQAAKASAPTPRLVAVRKPAPTVLAAIPSQPQPVVESLMRGLAILYLLGASLCTLRLLIGLAMLWRIQRRAVPAPDLTNRLRSRAKRKPIRVLLTDNACRPFCCGLLRQTIVLPRALGESASLDTVLEHELAHLDRRDPWSQTLFALATPLLWPHPLFWLVRTRARLAAEMIADNVAARATNKTDYARRLLDLVELDAVRPSAPIVAVPVFGRRSELARRIEMLMQREKILIQRTTTRHRLSRALASAILMTLVLGVFGATPVSAQDPGSTKLAELEAMNKDLRAENKSLRQTMVALRDRVDALTSAAKPAAAPPETIVVKVRAGDTLSRIARRIGGDIQVVDQILALNPELDPRRLKIGAKIVVPNRVLTLGSIPLLSDQFAVDLLSPSSTRTSRALSLALEHSTEGTISLIDVFLDSKSELAIATQRLTRLLPLFANNVATKDEVRTAEILLDAAKQRQALVRDLVEAELTESIATHARQTDTLSRTQALMKKGLVPESQLWTDESQVRRIQTRIRVLKAALK